MPFLRAQVRLHGAGVPSSLNVFLAFSGNLLQPSLRAVRLMAPEARVMKLIAARPIVYPEVRATGPIVGWERDPSWIRFLPVRNKTFANFLSLLHQLQKLILGRIRGGRSIYHCRPHLMLTGIVPIPALARYHVCAKPESAKVDRAGVVVHILSAQGTKPCGRH
jgi:hypothetical protein